MRRRGLKVKSVDLFAGGGGASEGIRMATGRAPVAAVNHCPHAIQMHRENHPDTLHYLESVFDVRPREVPTGRGGVDLLWASPDCTHFSRARGGKPVKKEIRGLAWVIVEWAQAVSPRVICMENVPEFVTWGPLYPEDHPDPGLRNRPIPERKGATFREFVTRLQLLGYRVEWRLLTSCDYGAPTRRRRLFLVARCDGESITWPTPTHGPGRARPWRTAAECIDWTIPCPSIFTRRRPLAENTQRRIAEGIRRYVIDTAEPFIVRIGQTGGGGSYTYSLDQPLSTITSKAEHCLVTTFLAKHNGKTVGQPLRQPCAAITGRDTKALVAASVDKVDANGATGAEPHGGLVAAFLLKYYGQGGQWSKLSEPMHTIVSKARMGLVTVDLAGEEYAITDIGMRMLQPRELARAQGFPEAYILNGTKTQQVARIGNSVPPQVVEAVVRAQFHQPSPLRSDEQLAAK